MHAHANSWILSMRLNEANRKLRVVVVGYVGAASDTENTLRMLLVA